MNELRERLIERARYEIDKRLTGGTDEDIEVATRIIDYNLAALGLDDLDAAVERLATFMSATEPYQHFHPENLKGHARRALEAALTPPEKP